MVKLGFGEQCELAGNDSGSWLMLGFVISNIELSGSITEDSVSPTHYYSIRLFGCIQGHQPFSKPLWTVTKGSACEEHKTLPQGTGAWEGPPCRARRGAKSLPASWLHSCHLCVAGR